MRKSHIPCPLLSLPIQGQHILYHNSSTLPKPLSQKPLNLPPSPLLPFEPKLPHLSTTTVYPLPLRSSNPIQLSSSAKSSTLLFFGRKGQAAAALELGFEGTDGLAVGVGDGLGDGLSGAFAGVLGATGGSVGALAGAFAGTFAGPFASSCAGAFALSCSMAPMVSPAWASRFIVPAF